MFAEYIQAALEKAEYKIIDNPEPIFGEVPDLEGVWATGMTVEECRRELISVIEGWIALRLKMGDSIPVLGSVAISVSTEPMAVV
jgi:predicted RNase H-like HicB family nuclease